jgi:basic membrane protein A
VIWHAADVTGRKRSRVRSRRGKVPGCYSDQTSLAPHPMAKSFEVNFEEMVQAVAHAVADQTFEGGMEWKPTVDWMWLLKAGTMRGYNPRLVTAPSGPRCGKYGAAFPPKGIDPPWIW